MVYLYMGICIPKRKKEESYMGFGDKFNSFMKSTGDKFKEAKDKMSESFGEMKEKNAEHKALNNEAKAPVEGAIIRYQVIYVGGFEQKPEKKSNSMALGLNILPDRFAIKPELLAKEQWFGDVIVEVPYTSVKKFEITKRQVSTAEALLSSNGDTKSLEQENNIEITYNDENCKEHKLRMEMLTGTTVYGQAAKCKEMIDLLREHEILAIFEKNANVEAGTLSSGVDIADQIAKLAALKEQGILSVEEFNAKKTDLLSKM